MALFPVYSNERDPNGLFRAESTFTGGEGGLVVRLTGEGANSPSLHTQNAPRVGYIAPGTTDASTAVYGLLDEQSVRPETSLGSFLPGNADPIGLGPATWRHSGRLSFWQSRGYFLTDNFQIALTSTSLQGEGYGEPANLVSGSALLCTNADSSSGVRRGTICDAATAATLSVATATTKLTYVSFVDDVTDLLASRVSPAPVTGMFRDGPRMLIYQA